MKQTEPYYLWWNAAEGSIKELKIGAGHKMFKAKSSKKLWGDCVELELYVCSYTAHNVYCLNGEMPENIISGETSDISHFCAMEWYEWIMFRELSVSFPEDKMVPGIYLVPSIDIGTDMNVNILKSNVEVVHRSTYQALLPGELERNEQQTARGSFDASAAIKCVPGAIVEVFDKLGAVETPEYDLYKDDTTDGAFPKEPPGELDPTPNAAPDHYLNTSVVLP